MYVWSILERHAPTFDLPRNCGINSHWHIRRGGYCLVTRVSHQTPSTMQTIRYGSFAVRGPMLFNTLPSELRNMTNCSPESYKQALETFLKTIPDEPQTPWYTYMRRAESNSRIHTTPLRTYHCPTSLKEEMKRTECNSLIHMTPLRAYNCPTSLKEEMKRTESNSLIHTTPLRTYHCPTSPNIGRT